MYGTLTTLDDLRDSTQSIQDFGEDNLAERLNTALRFQNQAMQEAVADFATVTNERQLAYGGGGDDFEMQEMDQNGTPDAQKTTAAGNIGLPLRFYGVAVQWNRHFVINTSVASVLKQMDAGAAADARNVTKQIRNALFTPTNNLSYVDMLQAPNLTLELRALLNADGIEIPNGPNGEEFDGDTVTHYFAESTLSENGLTTALDAVMAHGVVGSMAIYINRADEAAVRGFDAFTPYVDARINVPLTEQTAQGALDTNNPTDRAIGIFAGAEVHVKPWVPSDYQLIFDRGGGNEKVLGIRTRGGTMGGDAYNGGFGLLFENENFPIRARAMGREFGAGVINRHMAAVNYSGGGTYTAPSGL